MSELEDPYLNEYYSDINQVRQCVNERIDSLKRLLDERKIQLNTQLDSIEVEATNDEERSKRLIEELIDYEKVTINLFGEECPHLATIRSNIESLETDLSRKSIFFQWDDKTIVENLKWIGVVSHKSNDLYATIKRGLKMESKTIPTKEEPKVTAPTESCELPDNDNIEVTSKSMDFPGYTSITDEDYSDCEESYINAAPPTEKSPPSTIRCRYQAQSTTYERGNIREMAMLYQTGATKEHIRSTVPVYKRSNSMNILDIENPYQTIDERTLIEVVYEKQHYTPMNKLALRRCHSIPLDKELKVRDMPVIKWGDQGKGIRQLNKPQGVCVSEKGQIFVSEKGNNRVQVFTPDGHHSYMFGEKSGNNAMIEPNGIWVTNHFVFVTLTSLHTIQMYTLQGVFVKKKSKEGKEKGKFKFPVGITGDNLRGKLYICDTGNNRIQIFDMNLHFIRVMKTVTQLYRPLDIKVTKMGNVVIVLDRSPKCIHIFKSSGESIRDIIEVQSFSMLINSDPLYLAVDTQDNILLSDHSGNCIHVFTEKGDFIWRLGEAGIGKPFIEPCGIAFDRQGRLVTVCNKKEDQLQLFEVHNV